MLAVGASLSQALSAEKAKAGIFVDSVERCMYVGEFFRIENPTAEGHTCDAVLLDIEWTAQNPMRVQYHVPGYGRRIEMMHPEDLKVI